MATSRQTQPAPQSAAPLPQARPYKDFLTPALHRRFTRAAGLTLVLCWFEATLMSRGAGFFWSWFPISVTGLRTLLLFMPCLAVFIIRVANMHAGHLNTTSGFETFANHAASLRTASTVVWYVYSAWFFGEVYIWAQGQEGGLGWVDLGKSYERPRINENPVLLRWLYVFVALWQAYQHLARDTDRIRVEETNIEPRQNSEPNAQASLAVYMPKAIVYLSTQGNTILNRTLQLTFAGIIAGGVPSYYLLVRRTAWSIAYNIGRVFFHDLPTSAAPHGLVRLGTFAWQAFTSVGMLVFMWEVSNALFTFYVSEPPLKRGQPLTNEVKDARGMILSKSVDPNGSLLRGFRAKKDVPKTFAFWELHLICTQFPARRKTIFTEVDRKDKAGQPDSTWSQVSQICLAEIAAISTRIVKSQEPLQSQQSSTATQQQQQPSSTLPRISDRAIQSDRDIVQRPNNNDFAHTVGNVAKAFGQSPGAVAPVVPRAKKALGYATDLSVSKDTQQRWGSADGISRETKGYMTQFLQTPLGEPLRETFARRLRAVIFGVPYSNQVNIVHAARSLATLLVSSLKEDDYGQVAKAVPGVVRILTKTIYDVEGFVAAGLPPSWTDVEFDAKRDRQATGEVKEVMDVLKACLGEIVLAFGEYAGGLGLTRKELREAREASGGAGTEMVQAR